MANFEEDMKRITNEVLEDGTVDKIIRENVIAGFKRAIENAFSFGELRNAIIDRVKETMVPYIEEYDMSEYLLKLETCLSEIIKNSVLIDQKAMIGNFKDIMIDVPKKEWTLEELLGVYERFVAANIETDGLGIDYDDGVSYDSFEISAEIEEEDEKWYKSSIQDAHLCFKVDADNDDDNENIQFRIRISKYDNRDYWDIRFAGDPNIDRLRFMSDFEVFLMKLSRYSCVLVGTDTRLVTNIRPVREPEATFE